MSRSNIWHKPSDENRNRDKAQRVSFLVYPDSVADDWLNYLRDSNLKCVVSPLHDSDYNDDGSIIKPHYHLIVIYPSSVSWYAFDEIRKSINAFKHFEKLKSTSNMINYLTHDSYTAGAKVKYSRDDIIWINCCEYDFSDDEYMRVINFIEENNIKSFRSLINSLLQTGYQGQLLVKWVIPNTYFVNIYLKSRYCP